MRGLVAIAFWWLVVVGLWMLYVGQTTKENAVAGAIAAGVAVGFGVLLGRLGPLRFALDLRDLAPAVTIPWYVVRDFALVTAALFRGRPAGEFVELDFPVGGNDARSAGRRALVGLLGSVAPNAYVVDFDRDRGVVVLHELDHGRSKGKPL